MVSPKTPESFAIKHLPLQKNRFRPAKTSHFRFFAFSPFSVIFSLFFSFSFSYPLHPRPFSQNFPSLESFLFLTVFSFFRAEGKKIASWIGRGKMRRRRRRKRNLLSPEEFSEKRSRLFPEIRGKSRCSRARIIIIHSE